MASHGPQTSPSFQAWIDSLAERETIFNNGSTDNANINMNSASRVNDNEWHVFFGERYACYIENPGSEGSFNAEYAVGGRACYGRG